MHVAYVLVLKETRTIPAFEGMVPDGRPLKSIGTLPFVFASTPTPGRIAIIATP